MTRERVLDDLLQAIGDAAPDFPAMLGEFLGQIDDGDLAFAEELAATLHGYETLAGQQLDRLQRIMLALDLIAQLEQAETGSDTAPASPDA